MPPCPVTTSTRVQPDTASIVVSSVTPLPITATTTLSQRDKEGNSHESVKLPAIVVPSVMCFVLVCILVGLLVWVVRGKQPRRDLLNTLGRSLPPDRSDRHYVLRSPDIEMHDMSTFNHSPRGSVRVRSFPTALVPSNAFDSRLYNQETLSSNSSIIHGTAVGGPSSGQRNDPTDMGSGSTTLGSSSGHGADHGSNSEHDVSMDPASPPEDDLEILPAPAPMPMPMPSLPVPCHLTGHHPMVTSPSTIFDETERDIETQGSVGGEEQSRRRGIPRSHMMTRLPRIDSAQFADLSPIRAIRRIFPASPLRRTGRDLEHHDLVTPSPTFAEPEAGTSVLPAAPSPTSTSSKRKFGEVDNETEGHQDQGETSEQGQSHGNTQPQSVLYFGRKKRFSRINIFTALNSHPVYSGQEAIDKAAEDEAEERKEQAKKLQKKSRERVILELQEKFKAAKENANRNTDDDGDEQQTKKDKGKQVDRGLGPNTGLGQRLPALPNTPSVAAMTPAPLNIVKRHSFKDVASKDGGGGEKNIVRRAFTMITKRSSLATLLQTRSDSGLQYDMGPTQEGSSADNHGDEPSRQVRFDVPTHDEAMSQTPAPELSPPATRPSTPTPVAESSTNANLGGHAPVTPDFRQVARRRLSGRDPVSPRPVGGIFEGPEFAYLHEAIALHDGDKSNEDGNGGFRFNADDDTTTSTIFGGRGHGQGNTENDNGAGGASSKADSEDNDGAAVEKDDEEHKDDGLDSDSDDYRGLPPVTDMIQPRLHATNPSETTSTGHPSGVAATSAALNAVLSTTSRSTPDNSAAPPIPPRSTARPQSYVQQGHRYGGQLQGPFARQRASLTPEQQQHLQLRRISAPAVQGSPMPGRQPLPASALGFGRGFASSSSSQARSSYVSSARTSVTITAANAPGGAMGLTARPAVGGGMGMGTGLTPSSSSGSGSGLTESPSIDSWLENLVATPMGAAAPGATASSRSASGSTTAPAAAGATRIRADAPVTNLDGTVVHDFAFRMPAALPSVGDMVPLAFTGRAPSPPSPPPSAEASTTSSHENVAAGREAARRGGVRSKVREYENKAQTQTQAPGDRKKEEDDKYKEKRDKEKRESKPVEKPEGNWI